MPSNAHDFRSTATIHMVREETDHRTGKVRVIDAHLPYGKGWNNGNAGSLDWKNLNCGWVEYDVYMAKKNSEQAEVKRLKAAEDAEAELKVAQEEVAKVKASKGK